MRAENVSRLTYFKTNMSDPHYLVYKFLFRDIQDAVAAHAKGDVFDMGCGNKPYEPIFKNISSYTGCDIIQSSENKVDVICSTTSVPLESEKFDTVFSTQVMEHVEEPQQMLHEAHRLLRKDGKIILTVPMVWEHHEMPYDFYRYTRYGLEHMFKKAGFSNINIKANGGKWATLGQLTQNVVDNSLRGKKSILRKILWVLHRYMFKYLVNIFYYLMEKADKEEDFITLNFIVVAEKK